MSESFEVQFIDALSNSLKEIEQELRASYLKGKDSIVDDVTNKRVDLKEFLFKEYDPEFSRLIYSKDGYPQAMDVLVPKKEYKEGVYSELITKAEQIIKEYDENLMKKLLG